MHTQRRIRIGLIGAGSVVESYHLPALRGLPEVEIHWVCDKDLVRARAFAGVFKIPAAYVNLDDCPDVDVVLVGTPVGDRHVILDTVIARGWHALCEKPFALTLAQHEAIVGRARASGVQLAVGLQRRFYASTEIGRRVLDGDLLGAPQLLLAGEGMTVRRTGRGSDWYQGSAESSGGAFFETGSHLVDQVFTTCRVVSYDILRCRQRCWDGLEYETSVSGTLTLERGCDLPFALVVSRLHDVYNGIVVRCANGELRVGLSPERPVEICAHNGAPLAIAFSDRAVTGTGAAMLAEWRHFLGNCSGSGEFTDWDTGLLTTAFLEDCYRAAAQQVQNPAPEVGA